MPPPLPPPPPAAWQLLWADDFDRADPLGPGSSWQAQLGDGSQYGIQGWGNNERQWYTQRSENLRIENGQLVIQALQEHPPTLPGGRPFTSARIRTAGRFSVAPSPGCRVRIEARLRSTPGPGLWPAFWLLPEHDGTLSTASGVGSYGGWAASGEIDVMEMHNSMQEVIGSLHFGGPWPSNTYLSGQTALPPDEAGRFHMHAVEWDRQTMRWFLDGRQYFEAHSAKGTCQGGWWSGGEGAGADSPFDRPFHLLLNLALGSEGTPFTTHDGVGVSEAQLRQRLADPAGNPAQLLVDCVRVFSCPIGPGHPCVGAGDAP